VRIDDRLGGYGNLAAAAHTHYRLINQAFAHP
jgi:hypothetical protein